MSELYFVYGTLTAEPQVDKLLSTYEFRGRATCVGLERIDGEYPTLVPGESVDGRLLATPEGDRLDQYEGVQQGLYHRVRLPLSSQLPQTSQPHTTSDNQSQTTDYSHATVYIADPAKLGVDAETGWPAGSFPDCIAAYRDENEVKIIPENKANYG